MDPSYLELRGCTATWEIHFYIQLCCFCNSASVETLFLTVSVGLPPPEV